MKKQIKIVEDIGKGIAREDLKERGEKKDELKSSEVRRSETNDEDHKENR